MWMATSCCSWNQLGIHGSGWDCSARVDGCAAGLLEQEGALGQAALSEQVFGVNCTQILQAAVLRASPGQNKQRRCVILVLQYVHF